LLSMNRVILAAMAVTAVCAIGIAVDAQSVLTPDQLKYRPVRPNLDETAVEILPVQGSVFLIST